MGRWAFSCSAADAAFLPRSAPSSLPEPLPKRPEMHRRNSCGLTVPAEKDGLTAFRTATIGCSQRRVLT